MHTYYTYILTNKNKTVLYIGFTNNLAARLHQHLQGLSKSSFTAKYNCHYLVYFETFQDPQQGINREKELKGWKREKKMALINSQNPDWRFLNDDILGTNE